jgi:hypothetical protein
MIRIVLQLVDNVGLATYSLVQLNALGIYSRCRGRQSITTTRRWNAPYPIPNCEAKSRSAILVLRWGTTRESIGVVIFWTFATLFFCSGDPRTRIHDPSDGNHSGTNTVFIVMNCSYVPDQNVARNGHSSRS